VRQPVYFVVALLDVPPLRWLLLLVLLPEPLLVVEPVLVPWLRAPPWEPVWPLVLCAAATDAHRMSAPTLWVTISFMVGVLLRRMDSRLMDVEGGAGIAPRSWRCRNR